MRETCLCVGFYRPGTGLSRVMETITQQLADEYDFHLIGIGYKGPILKQAITIYPCNLEGGDVYGAYQLKDRIAQLNPALVFILNDLWIIPQYGRTCGEEAKSVPFIAYAAIDGRITSPEPVQGLDFLSRLVAYTQFAKEDLETYIQREKGTKRTASPVISQIGHGVDTDRFHPLDNRLELKARFFPQIADPESSFIVLNANRPHGRKRLDLTINGFARFAQNRPNARLMIHNSVIEDAERDELTAAAQYHGIVEQVDITPKDAPFMRDAELNELYNACDVGINTSMGEGWGMVSMEHAAAGRPQIVPAHSACLEIWSGVTQCTDIAKRVIPRFSMFELAEIKPEVLATQLSALYDDPAYYDQQARRSRQHVLQAEYSWANVAEQWKAVFDQAQAEKNLKE